MVMKKTKIAASLLAVTMLAGMFSGCSKVNGVAIKDFEKACEKLNLEEWDLLNDKTPESDALEDGVYTIADEDEVEEIISQNTDKVRSILSIMDLNKVIDTDDILSFGFAAKCDDADSFVGIEEPEDIKIDGAVAMQITLENGEYAEEILDGIDDLAGMAGIRTKHLGKNELYSSKKEGYIRFHIDLEEIAELAAEDDELLSSFKNYMDRNLDYYIGGLKGDLVVDIEVNGGNVFVLIGLAVNTDASVYKDFAKAFGIKNDPMKLPANEKITEDLTDLFPSIAKYLTAAKQARDQARTDPVVKPDTDKDKDKQPGIQGQGQKAGISLPTKDLMNWKQDGELMLKEFNELGYEVDLQFAGNDVSTQVQQIQNMIYSGCKVLIIAPIESSSLGPVLDLAKKKDVRVIAYDRIINDNENVDYFVTFDRYMAGVLQGEYIRNALDLDNAKGSFNMEITAGDPRDFNAGFFFNGAMDVLRPYIDSGKLRVVSGQVDFDSCATDGWSTATAQSRAEKIIASFYSGGTKIDAWLCSNDSTACGVVNAIEATYPGDFPIITGMDCDILSVRNIIHGKQSMSVFNDRRTLAKRAVLMATQLLNGQDVEVNDTVTYNNGKKTVPSFLCSPIFVDKNNYKTVLIDSGYYTADMI